MIKNLSAYFRLLLYLLLVSIASAIAALLGVSTEFYVWEFPVDAKVVLFALVLFLFIRKDYIKLLSSNYGIRKWDTEPNILAFLGPLILLLVTVLAGYLAQRTTFEGADNAVTLLLAIILDVPAAYFFSVAMIFLEELMFRGLIFDFVSRENGIFKSVLVSCIIWIVANLDKVVQNRSSSVFDVSAELLYLFSIGLACSAIYYSSKSIWPAYSFRIGVLVFSSAMLTSDVNETSGVFFTESPTFSNSGILLSLMLIAFASSIFMFSKSMRIPHEIR